MTVQQGDLHHHWERSRLLSGAVEQLEPPDLSRATKGGVSVPLPGLRKGVTGPRPGELLVGGHWSPCEMSSPDVEAALGQETQQRAA